MTRKLSTAVTKEPADAPEVSAQDVVADAPVDPFASLPRITVEDYSIVDLLDAETANPRKYTQAQENARKLRSQLKPGWKHATAMLAVGPHEPEGMKPTSVMGMIRQKVQSYGRAGVPAYVIVDYLRREARDNKRSHYAQGKTPPIGWAEDYINGALAKKLVKVLEGKVAPSLSGSPTEQAEAVEAVAEDRKAA